MFFYILVAFVLFQDKPGVVYVWTPILVAAIFAYLIAHCFISVYEVTFKKSNTHIVLILQMIATLDVH